MITHLLYLHGFNSSPGSMKAELTKAYFAEHFPDIKFVCPQVKSSPLAALDQLETILVNQQGTQKNEKWGLIGSSLGGYFSTYFSEKYNLPAALVNPAITPYELLADYIGEQVNPYTKERYLVKAEHMDQLKALKTEKINEKNYLVMVQTADEVLDYRQAQSKFQQANLIVQQGGDHSFVNFDAMLPTIAEFFVEHATASYSEQI